MLKSIESVFLCGRPMKDGEIEAPGKRHARRWEPGWDSGSGEVSFVLYFVVDNVFFCQSHLRPTLPLKESITAI